MPRKAKLKASSRSKIASALAGALNPEATYQKGPEALAQTPGTAGQEARTPNLEQQYQNAEALGRGARNVAFAPRNAYEESVTDARSLVKAARLQAMSEPGKAHVVMVPAVAGHPAHFFVASSSIDPETGKLKIQEQQLTTQQLADHYQQMAPGVRGTEMLRRDLQALTLDQDRAKQARISYVQGAGPSPEYALHSEWQRRRSGELDAEMAGKAADQKAAGSAPWSAAAMDRDQHPEMYAGGATPGLGSKRATDALFPSVVRGPDGRELPPGPERDLQRRIDAWASDPQLRDWEPSPGEGPKSAPAPLASKGPEPGTDYLGRPKEEMPAYPDILDSARFPEKYGAPPLDPDADFKAWKAKYAPNDSGADYDLRGAFAAGETPGTDGHWTDKFKKPNHPTFSVDSQYATGLDRAKAGRWEGDQFVPPPTTGLRDHPSMASEVSPRLSPLDRPLVPFPASRPTPKPPIDLGTTSITGSAPPPPVKGQTVVRPEDRDPFLQNVMDQGLRRAPPSPSTPDWFQQNVADDRPPWKKKLQQTLIGD